MLVDLVQTVTRDGVRLDGTFQPAEPRPDAPLDAFCLVHGTGGNFYNSSLFDHLTPALLEMGCGVLRVNTRGHDGLSTAVTARGGRRLGAAYEVVDDSRHDVAAWVGWLCERGCARIGLLGHSLGAVKCVYALAHEPDLPVSRVVAVSPPRLSYSYFCETEKAADFLTLFRRAEAEVAAGRPDSLMEAGFPLPLVITAAGYVEKYGPDERYHFFKYLSGVPCPVLVTIGAVEAANNVAFRSTVDALGKLSPRLPNLSVGLIDGADHFYTAARDHLRDTIVGWLRTGAPGAGG